MNILYTSRVCSDVLFDKLFLHSKNTLSQEAQKFHSLLIKSIESTNLFTSIVCLSVLPISYNKKMLYEDKNNKEISYDYINPKGFILLKHMKIILKSFTKTYKWAQKNKNTEKIIIHDTLNFSLSIGIILASVLLRIKVICIITDVPKYMLQQKTMIHIYDYMYTFLTSKIISFYDAYILVADEISKEFRIINKPYIIIEGIVDAKINFIKYTININKPGVILYTGGLQKNYGIIEMIDAFKLLNTKDFELHIYGRGVLESYIMKIHEEGRGVVYKGYVKNSEILNIQQNASILINPRPSNTEFSKFSFPSKLIEYMASGTPVLSTRLKSIPNEYNNYLFYFNDESVSGIADMLKNVTSMSNEILYYKGKEAQKFILENKSYIQRGKMISKFVFDVINN